MSLNDERAIWQGETDGSNEALVRDFKPCVTVDDRSNHSSISLSRRVS